MYATLKRFASTARNVGSAINPDIMFSNRSQVVTYISKCKADTESIGKALGSVSKRGMVILLQGKLAIGKTVFARGFVRGACHDDSLEVNSPTFLLDNSYLNSSGTIVHHMDMYRIKTPADAEPLGLQGIFMTDISIVEWPQRVAGFVPEDHLLVQITAEDDKEFPQSSILRDISPLTPHSAPSLSVDEDAEDTLARAITFVPRGQQYVSMIHELRRRLPFTPLA